VPASCQTHSESQQNDREYEQSDGGQAIIALPKVTMSITITRTTGSRISIAIPMVTMRISRWIA